MKTIYKPILFSTPMVQAIEKNNKTQTRRIVTQKYSNTDLQTRTDKYGTQLVEMQNDAPPPRNNDDGSITHSIRFYAVKYPKYKIGDILWVRETYVDDVFGQYFYRSSDDLPGDCAKWKPSIFMPKAVARHFLKVTNVRFERLSDISESDAIAEGFGPVITEEYPAPGKFINHLNKHHMFNAVDSFASMWVKLHGKGAWKANPWVFVYEFKKIEKPQNWSL
ncbi:hypothetical protein [Epilithonimonas hominis]|uniref:hypothetical protein n=1 Tax=Epilithonimonas hominis TaxID=420404 RepID=UPI0028A16A88|nr:hypothetical protein [Epilithonimonas hominis]